MEANIRKAKGRKRNAYKIVFKIFDRKKPFERPRHR
jgi:hypothetical protein